LYGERLNAVYGIVVDKFAQPGNDAVVTYSQSTAGNARLGANRRELIIKASHESSEQLRRHYPYNDRSIHVQLDN